MVKLVVTSTVAGRHRAGAVFTGAMMFDPGHFTPEQLKKIIADPVLTVVAGNVVKAENLEEYFDQVALFKAFQAAQANGDGLFLTEGRQEDQEQPGADPAPAEPASIEDVGVEAKHTDELAAEGGKKHGAPKGKAAK